MFRRGDIQSEADLRWKIASVLSRTLGAGSDATRWRVHTEVPFRVDVRGRMARRRPDIVVSTPTHRVVKAVVEIKVFDRKPMRADLGKDSETLTAISALPFVQKGCLLYVYLSDSGPEPAFLTRALWANDFLLQVPLPVPPDCIESYFKFWKWQ